MTKGSKGAAVGLMMLLAVVLAAGCGRVSSGAGSAQMRTVTDLASRAVSLPADVGRVVTLHPVATYLVYRLAPDKLVSVDSVFRQEYLAPGGLRCYAAADRQRLGGLPDVGVFFKGVDPEEILALRPDVVITMATQPGFDAFVRRIGVPVVAMDKNSLTQYIPTIRLVGEIVGNEAGVEKLAAYWEAVLKRVLAETGAVPVSQRPRVYYANQGILYTPGPGSVMASIIEAGGGVNVAAHLPEPHNENTPVSLEEVVSWNPQVILTGTETEKRQIMSGAGWQGISAVKNHRVYVRSRYANTDGISAIMGLVWAQDQLLHPGDEARQQAFAGEMRRFYALFFHYRIASRQIAEVAR